MISSNPFEEQWAFVLSDTDEHVRHIAERASREPSLRRLFPYPSMSNLHFSTTNKYPYDPLPYVLTATGPEPYEARDADNRPLAEGDLETVIATVVRAIELKLGEQPR